MDIDIYLIDLNGPQLRIPVNPEEINIKREKLYETINLVNLGEADMAGKGTRIAELSFSSFFPGEYDPSYCRYAEIPDPVEAMAQLVAWTESRDPVRLIVTGLNVNQLVTVSAHTVTARGGEPDDIYYELTCRSWREVRVRTVEQAAPSPARPDLRKPPKVYTVKAGDTLFKIAKLELGDSSKWRSIYETNKQTIGPDPDLIRPGQRLVMPA